MVQSVQLSLIVKVDPVRRCVYFCRTVTQ